MWRILTTFFYLAIVNAYQVPSYPPYVIDDRAKHDWANQPIGYSANQQPFLPHPSNQQIQPRYGGETYTNPYTQQHNYFQQKTGPGLIAPPPPGYYLRSNDARQGLKNFFAEDPFDDSSDGSDLFLDGSPSVEPRNPNTDATSIVEDINLVENFGKYLLKRTEQDLQASTSLTDAPHQYNALFTVLVALARAVRSSCADFDKMYEQLYYPTIDNYFKYGLTNADKVPGMIEDYIKRGNARIQKIKKAVLETCKRDTYSLYCGEAVESRIKSTPLVYIKELETLEALSHLARSFFPYIEEFDLAANKGTMLAYLKANKDRLKEYVMHMVNSVDHLTDKPVKCP